jgi:hypothetical protein
VPLVVAIIAAVVSVSSAILSLYGQRRIAILQDQLTREREQQSSKAKAEALLAKYRDPLLRAAQSMQTRFFNIVQLGFLRVYYNKSERDKKYAKTHTLYAIAEYLGWVEVVRREVQFLDLGDVEATRRLQGLLHAVSRALLTDEMPLNFRIFTGDQRAIGELMLTERNRGGEGTFFDCIRFAEFTHRIVNVEFSSWFETLLESIAMAANDPDPDYSRLVLVQHALIDLIDFLDPDRIRIPQNRERISFARKI